MLTQFSCVLVLNFGLQSLAISFTNESYDRASHAMLLRWLRATYPSVTVPEETVKAIASHASWDTHNHIKDLFLNLARTQHSEGVMESDVQICLGVLFYTNGEYDRAKDCFESALSVKPHVIFSHEANSPSLTSYSLGLYNLE